MHDQYSLSLFLFSVAGSLVASFVFLILILVFLRPSIKISNIIVFDKDEIGIDCYRIKFYNTSLFSAYDVNIDLIELEERQAEPKGKHIFFNDIKLTRNKFTFIHRWNPSFLTKHYAHHCTQIKTYENLSKILDNPHDFLQLKITLRHGLTGLSKNYIKAYRTKTIIKAGSFEFGNSFDLVK